jgi:hypothetical protein
MVAVVVFLLRLPVAFRLCPLSVAGPARQTLSCFKVWSSSWPILVTFAACSRTRLVRRRMRKVSSLVVVLTVEE